MIEDIDREALLRGRDLEGRAPGAVRQEDAGGFAARRREPVDVQVDLLPARAIEVDDDLVACGERVVALEDAVQPGGGGHLGGGGRFGGRLGGCGGRLGGCGGRLGRLWGRLGRLRGLLCLAGDEDAAIQGIAVEPAGRPAAACPERIRPGIRRGVQIRHIEGIIGGGVLREHERQLEDGRRLFQHVGRGARDPDDVVLDGGGHMPEAIGDMDLRDLRRDGDSERIARDGRGLQHLDGERHRIVIGLELLAVDLHGFDAQHDRIHARRRVVPRDELLPWVDAVVEGRVDVLEDVVGVDGVDGPGAVDVGIVAGELLRRFILAAQEHVLLGHGLARAKVQHDADIQVIDLAIEIHVADEGAVRGHLRAGGRVGGVSGTGVDGVGTVIALGEDGRHRGDDRRHRHREAHHAHARRREQREQAFPMCSHVASS